MNESKIHIWRLVIFFLAIPGLVILGLGILGPDTSYSTQFAADCRVPWGEFSARLKQNKLSLNLQHLIPGKPGQQDVKFCQLDREAGTLTILPYGPEEHFCKLRFPDRLQKLKNGWSVQRLDISGGGARWRMRRDHSTGGFVLNLQGDNRRLYSIRITSLYIRNRHGKAPSCQDSEKSWHMLF